MTSKLMAIGLAVCLASASLANAGKLSFSGPMKGGGGASAPTCLSGWATEAQASWLLICRIIVDPALKFQTVAAAGSAVCNVNRYWNYGPNVKILEEHRSFVEISYTCGHVEG